MRTKSLSTTGANSKPPSTQNRVLKYKAYKLLKY